MADETPRTIQQVLEELRKIARSVVPAGTLSELASLNASGPWFESNSQDTHSVKQLAAIRNTISALIQSPSALKSTDPNILQKLVQRLREKSSLETTLASITRGISRFQDEGRTDGHPRTALSGGRCCSPALLSLLARAAGYESSTHENQLYMYTNALLITVTYSAAGDNTDEFVQVDVSLTVNIPNSTDTVAQVEGTAAVAPQMRTLKMVHESKDLHESLCSNDSMLVEEHLKAIKRRALVEATKLTPLPPDVFPPQVALPIDEPMSNVSGAVGGAVASDGIEKHERPRLYIAEGLVLSRVTTMQLRGLQQITRGLHGINIQFMPLKRSKPGVRLWSSFELNGEKIRIDPHFGKHTGETAEGKDGQGNGSGSDNDPTAAAAKSTASVSVPTREDAATEGQQILIEYDLVKGTGVDGVGTGASNGVASEGVFRAHLSPGIGVPRRISESFTRLKNEQLLSAVGNEDDTGEQLRKEHVALMYLQSWCAHVPLASMETDVVTTKPVSNIANQETQSTGVEQLDGNTTIRGTAIDPSASSTTEETPPVNPATTPISRLATSATATTDTRRMPTLEALATVNLDGILTKQLFCLNEPNLEESGSTRRGGRGRGSLLREEQEAKLLRPAPVLMADVYQNVAVLRNISLSVSHVKSEQFSSTLSELRAHFILGTLLHSCFSHTRAHYGDAVESDKLETGLFYVQVNLESACGLVCMVRGVPDSPDSIAQVNIHIDVDTVTNEVTGRLSVDSDGDEDVVLPRLVYCDDETVSALLQQDLCVPVLVHRILTTGTDGSSGDSSNCSSSPQQRVLDMHVDAPPLKRTKKD